MKNLSTGTGLALLATAIVAYPFVNRISSVDQTAHASVPVAAIAAAATAQANPEPTIVWMGVYHDSFHNIAMYHRLWSDGRLEARSVSPRLGLPSSSAECTSNPLLEGFGCSSPWIEVPPPPAGNGFACRSDLNGDRTVDGADLSFILANWGPQQPCEPEATYPCLTIPGGSLVQ
jgi:hypothetical protein